MSSHLPSIIHPGILHFPTTPEDKSCAEVLLQRDRNSHHCFYSRARFHNHLSHHILAAFDLGAPAEVLEAIYNRDSKVLRPIHLDDRSDVEINCNNWKEHLGVEKHYASYLSFFTSEIATNGVENTFESFVFNTEDGSNMLARFVGGVFHPFIQAGYAAEFQSEAMMAQALAQTAVHNPFLPELVVPAIADNCAPLGAISLFEILRQVYDSEILHPVMPYDPDANIMERFAAASQGGRLAEIRRISAKWLPSGPISPEVLAQKTQEMFWVATLLLAATSKRGRKRRLDFFLMHTLNASIFFPSILHTITRAQSRLKLLKAYLPVLLIIILIRGRPRIDPELIMTFSATPHPPTSPAVTSPMEPQALPSNPWTAIINSAFHAPDAHTVKAIRALFYAAKQYGLIKPGDVVGAERTHKGIEKLDGTVFIRAAGVVMDTMGWVDHGQPAGSWDTSALGWDEAWNDGK